MKKKMRMNVITLAAVGSVCLFPFASNFVQAIWPDEDGISGQWVGVVNVALLSDKISGPIEKRGNVVARIGIHQDYFAFLTLYVGTGEMRDPGGIIKRFEIRHARILNSGRITGTLVGLDDDDTLSGELNGDFAPNQLTIKHTTTSEFQIDGILRKGSDEQYEDLFNKLVETQKRLGNLR